jgi:HK97 family phage major capsid protein
MLSPLFMPAAAVMLLTLLLIAIAQRSPLSLTERFRLLATTLRLDSGEFVTSAELREKCAEAATKLLDLRGAAPDKRDDAWAVQAKDARDALLDLDAIAQATERNERHALETLAWNAEVAEAEARAKDPGRRGASGPGAAFNQIDADLRSAGQQFVESDAYTRARDGGSFNVDETEVRNLLTGSSIGTSGSNELALIGQPFLHTPSLRRRRLFVRDLMSVASTNLQVIPYVQELNAITNETGAGMTSEASAKTEVTMQFTPAEAAVRKITAWVQVTEEAYADAPTLRSYVDERLSYMIMLKEEDQVINGNGTAPNISGILDQSGLQTQSAVADDLAATIGLAASKVENVDGSFDGTAINPLTYWEGVVERHANQMDGGATDAGMPFNGPPPSLWGEAVVRTRAVTVDTAIVGNWQQGATIYDRTQGVTLKTSDSHASLFISNTLVVLAEKRTALAVWRPDYFVNVTLSFS